MQKAYLINLTSLRGVAAILVAVLHFHFFLSSVTPDRTPSIIDKFYLMVDLFFILSGFIMCYVYEHSFNSGVEKKSYRGFLIARIARIYPLHILTLMAEVAIFLTLYFKGKFDFLPPFQQHLYRLDAIPVQLTFLQTVGIYNFDTWNAPAWSLSAEWWAYMIFPFLFYGFKRIGYDKWVIGLLMAITGWLSIEFILSAKEPFMNFPLNPDKSTLDVNWHYGTLRGIVGFLAGMVKWQLYRNNKFKNLIGNAWAFFGILGLCLLAMHFDWFDTLTVFLFAILILSSAYGSKTINRIYAWKPLVRLGEWSFSIYIWHMVIINVVRTYFVMEANAPVKGLSRPLEEGPGFLLLLVFLLIICAVGWTSFRFIETPTRKWIRNFNKSS